VQGRKSRREEKDQGRRVRTERRRKKTAGRK
jgi:hypothetical protein